MGFWKIEKNVYDPLTGNRVAKEVWSDKARTVFIAAGIFSLFAFILLVFAVTLTSPDATKKGVVRNGGPFDGRDVRGVVEPASGLHYVGMYSTVNYYPTNQRYYTITADAGHGDRLNADAVQVPTKDGVPVNIEAQFYFTLNTDDKTLISFDTRYGTRTYPVPGTGDQKKPSEGDEGWAAWLDVGVRPNLERALRQVVGQYNCAELNASCSLIKESSSSKNVNVNLNAVETAVAQRLQTDMDATLGGQYLHIDNANIPRVTFTDKVKDAVDNANAARAEVSTEKANALQAKYKAEATLAQAKANRANPYDALAKVCASGTCVLNLGGSGGLNLGFNK